MRSRTFMMTAAAAGALISTTGIAQSQGSDDFFVAARDSQIEDTLRNDPDQDQEEIDAADPARPIDQEPGLDLDAPRFRHVDEQPNSGDAGDVYNTTNISQYEQNVAGDVYAPVLSSENVNKLYVDNSLSYLTENFNVQINAIRTDIRVITGVLEDYCKDLTVIRDNFDWQKDGESYSFVSELGEACGEYSWKIDKTIVDQFEDWGYNHGCTAAGNGWARGYRYMAHITNHYSWGSAHDNAQDRKITWRWSSWEDTNGDGRDDATYDAYTAGYDDGWDACDGGGGTDPGGDPGDGGTNNPPEDENDGSTITRYVQTNTPILLTRDRYNPDRSYKANGEYDLRDRDDHDWQVGDYAYYSGVATTKRGQTVDARITLLENRYNIPVSMSRNSVEKNVIQLYGSRYLDGAYAWFNIEFLDGATGNPLFVETHLTTGDLDGTDEEREDVLYRQADIRDYSVTNNSRVRIQTPNGYVIASGDALNNPRGPEEAENQKHWFSVRFRGSEVEFGLSPRSTTSGFGFNGMVITEDVVVEPAQ